MEDAGSPIRSYSTNAASRAVFSTQIGASSSAPIAFSGLVPFHIDEAALPTTSPVRTLI